MNTSVRFACMVVTVSVLAACSKSPDAAPPPPSTAAAPAPVKAAPAPLSPELAALLVRPHSPVLGNAKAPVTVVEVIDPACEACRAFAPVVKQLLFLYPDEVRVVVRLADFHSPSEEAIRVLLAARQQGKFDDLLSALFERQEEWASHSAPDPDRVWKIAGDVGVNVPRARKDARAAPVDEVLRTEAADLTAIQVERTPTFFVNGKLLEDFGAQQLLDLVAGEVRGARPSAGN